MTALAEDADLLIHDAQYTHAEYPAHVGWGHSAIGDTLAFAGLALFLYQIANHFGVILEHGNGLGSAGLVKALGLRRVLR